MIKVSHDNNIAEMIIIGGLVFNHTPTAVLTQLGSKIRFIDINSFTAPFNLNEITQQVERTLSSYNQPVILVGYSTGGLIGMKLATEMPHLVHKLILINSTPCFLSKGDWHGINSPDFWRLSKKLTSLSLEQFKYHFSCLATYPQIYKAVHMLPWQSIHCTKDNIANWLEVIFTTDLRQQLAQLSKSVLSIYAEHDHLVPNSNNLENRLFTQYTLNNSSHAELNTLALVNQVEKFIT